MNTPLAPDQFRVGETWMSPSGKQWIVERITSDLRAVLVSGSTKRGYRNTRAVKNWKRIDQAWEVMS